MTKKYFNNALLYTIIALVSGVFYREFTKFNGFTGKTNLSVMHTHFFALGMLVFLLLTIFEKNFSFSKEKNTNKYILGYNIGLIITGLMMLIRGVVQVVMTDVSKGLDASISGVSGIGHIILGVSLIMILLNIRKSIEN